MTQQEKTPITERKLRAGIVGGGPGSFIGTVHRIASQLDNQAEVISGAMSPNPRRAEEGAKAWYLQRWYSSYQEMAQQEAARPDGIDFVIIATPNHLHYPVAKAFLEQHIHVVCDKPLTGRLEEAQEMAALIEHSNVIFALTHNYTGYPAVRQAQYMVRQGMLGDIRKVLVEYIQGWLMEPVEQGGNKQAAWRTDPTQSGISGCLGDIGTHGENLLEFITGLKVRSLCADLTTFVPGRALEDDANILLRLDNGAKGVLTGSQVAAGEENGLSIRIYGSKAGLEWHQMEPNTLLYKLPDQPSQFLRTGMPYMSEEAKQATRLPAGHPEGFYEAFANIYRMVITDIRRVASGEQPLGGYPTVSDGLRGVNFVAKAVESSNRGSVWVDL